MSKIKVFDIDGSISSEVEIDKKLLVDKIHEQAIFDSIISERASRRQGTHSTLQKGEVSGGGKKPYKQKHTGRARQGSIRNPHYVGGGIAFGPKPNRNYALKVNKKISQLAFCSAFTHQVNKMVVMGLNDDIKPDSYSSKALNKLVEKIIGNKKSKVLIVIGKDNEILSRSANNLKNITLKKWNQVSTEDMLNAKNVIVQPSALNQWMERMN
ncbi:50S ribosomal protein L4 [Mycoplasmoides alvi]|uniref:50S ribosomal protein L4 n=1 Tax=Mycoplasmoides alvi TaxID=78580 RepID=UPI00051B70FD|nr:50S ribosomal protein L4 [Mycoplasmoides alvi]